MKKSISHPSTAEMVTAAIQELNERKGSSFQAIKKFISITYEIDVEKFAPFIKRYLKAAIANGLLIQTRGHGASGSFKLLKNKIAKPSARKATLASRVKKIHAEKKKINKKVAVKKPKVKSTTTLRKATKPSSKKVAKAVPTKEKSVAKVKKTPKTLVT